MENRKNQVNTILFQLLHDASQREKLSEYSMHFAEFSTLDRVELERAASVQFVHYESLFSKNTPTQTLQDFLKSEPFKNCSDLPENASRSILQNAYQSFLNGNLEENHKNPPNAPSDKKYEILIQFQAGEFEEMSLVYEKLRFLVPELMIERLSQTKFNSIDKPFLKIKSTTKDLVSLEPLLLLIEKRWKIERKTVL